MRPSLDLRTDKTYYDPVKEVFVDITIQDSAALLCLQCAASGGMEFFLSYRQIVGSNTDGYAALPSYGIEDLLNQTGALEESFGHTSRSAALCAGKYDLGLQDDV